MLEMAGYQRRSRRISTGKKRPRRRIFAIQVIFHGKSPRFWI